MQIRPAIKTAAFKAERKRRVRTEMAFLLALAASILLISF
jgi:hypothetical protein